MSLIYDVVADVISTRFGIERSEVVPDASFEELGLDSLSQFELGTVLKHRFGIEIPDEELAEIEGVSGIVDRYEEMGAKV